MMKPPAIGIRRVEPGDAEALQGLYSSPKAMSGTLQLPFPSVEMWRKRLAEWQADDYLLVAEVEGELVGNAGLHSMGSMGRSARRRHAGYVGMAVRDDWHGRGVGTALMAAIVDVADNWLGYRRLELTVYTDNESALALYRKFGFDVEGTLREYSYRNGRYVDVYTMARLSSKCGSAALPGPPPGGGRAKSRPGGPDTPAGTKEIRRKLTKTQRKRT
jgi:putative acetyltransferase